jgi:hypothetical protein
VRGITNEDQFSFVPGWDGCPEEKRPLLDIFCFPEDGENRWVEISIAFEESGLADGGLPIFSCWQIITVEDGDKVVLFVAVLLSRGFFFLGRGKRTFDMDTTPIFAHPQPGISSVRHRSGRRNGLFRDLREAPWRGSGNGRRSCNLWLGGLDSVHRELLPRPVSARRRLQ